MLGLTPDQIRNGLILYLLLMGCLCLRAYGQAWLANRLGDPTPEATGRLTANPLPHLDVIGSVILPLICIFYIGPNLGSFSLFLAWTKPVPINPNNFTRPARHHLYTQMMNPVVSVACATLAAVVGALLYRSAPSTMEELFVPLIAINSSLMVLDFLPLPPLPGGMLLRELGLISEEMFWSVARWGGLLLLIAFQIPQFQILFRTLVGYLATPFLLLVGLIVQ
jgi:Zn-dependent protease